MAYLRILHVPRNAFAPAGAGVILALLGGMQGSGSSSSLQESCFLPAVNGTELRLGGDEAAGDALFVGSGRAGEGALVAVSLRDGTVAVADLIPSLLYVFGPDGTLRATLGEPREGPGGFNMLAWVHRNSSTSIVTYDYGKREFTYITADGRVVGTKKAAVGERRLSPVAGPLADGSFVYTSAVNGHTTIGSKPGVSRETLELHIIGPRPVEHGLTGRVPNTERYHNFEYGIFSRRLPFGRETSFGVLGDTIVIATGDAPAIELIGAAAATRDTVAVPLQRFPVGGRDVKAFKDDILERVTASARTDDETRNMVRLLESIPYPDSVPPYKKMLVDPRGYFWLEVYPRATIGGQRFAVVDRQGNLRATVAIAGLVDLLDVGENHLVGLSRDSLDVETVIVLRRGCGMVQDR